MYHLVLKKFRGAVYKDGVLIKGFSCYCTEHAHKLATEYWYKLNNE